MQRKCEISAVKDECSEINVVMLWWGMLLGIPSGQCTCMAPLMSAVSNSTVPLSPH